MKAIDDLHRRGAQDVVISRAGEPAIALIDKRRHRVAHRRSTWSPPCGDHRAS
jgi:hypothetical protein